MRDEDCQRSTLKGRKIEKKIKKEEDCQISTLTERKINREEYYER